MGDFVQINVSNSQNDTVSFEKKFPRDIKIAELKGKLEVITGASAGTMQLLLFSGDKLIAQLNDDEAELGSFAIENDMRLHVVDNVQSFIDDGNVEKFDLTDKQYDERRNTVRDYLKTRRLGKYNDDEMKAIEERKKQEQLEQEQKAESINIGDRCLVTAKGPRRIGTIRYKGTFHLKPGIFIGVEFDEPLGIHNGSVDGTKYFECQEKYGSMVPIGAIEVGDFPREDDGLDDDEI
ncbi:tubulin-folding cofactor B [Contarinia nasturtii]|uniref:tubulin-folding cofactor B n=1 Tax=Contarinia nasturtii TaxID=265458 RepID=UPI0012D3CA74|nr:tubulin-folding cofactor B [Contarinia nasturtii]